MRKTTEEYEFELMRAVYRQRQTRIVLQLGAGMLAWTALLLVMR